MESQPILKLTSTKTFIQWLPNLSHPTTAKFWFSIARKTFSQIYLCTSVIPARLDVGCAFLFPYRLQSFSFCLELKWWPAIKQERSIFVRLEIHRQLFYADLWKALMEDELTTKEVHKHEEHLGCWQLLFLLSSFLTLFPSALNLLLQKIKASARELMLTGWATI